MKITLLGTGTSQGVPVIGCTCNVCLSTDPRDKRLRTSALVQYGHTTIVIDVGPDFRQQMLLNPIGKLDAVLITHEHNDHVIGLDDIRPFYFRQQEGIQYFASDRVFREIRTRFPYVFDENPYPGAPRISSNLLQPYKSFQVKDLEIVPFTVYHGQLEVMCFRINKLAYITDASSIPPKSMELLYDLDVLIINALRRKVHYSHFNLEQALNTIEELKPERAYLTHISHLMGLTSDIEKELPDGVYVGHDNISIIID